MLRGPLCATVALLASAGHAFAFTFGGVYVPAHGSVGPTAGEFFSYSVDAPNQFLIDDATVNKEFATWDPAQDLPRVLDTTFLAIDVHGPGSFTGVSEPSGAATNPAPLSNYFLGSSDSGLNRGPSGTGLLFLRGGSAGLHWAPGPGLGFEIDSQANTINGSPTQSVWIGQFIVTDPGIGLIGDNLIAMIDGVEVELPLDGGFITDKSGGSGGTPYQLRFERSPAGPFAPAGAERLELFIAPVPAPGAACIAALGGLAVWGRRR